MITVYMVSLSRKKDDKTIKWSGAIKLLTPINLIEPIKLERTN